jgi:hypothetical protein
MSGCRLTEGALAFTFKPGAIADHYDRWSFYRNQFQNGCAQDNKAVDLVCRFRQDTWLIEVKDYRQQARTKPTELADEIAAKVRDTLAGLVAARCNANDAKERDLARQLLSAKRIRVVLHLEQPVIKSRLHPRGIIEPDKLTQKLRSKLKALDPHPMIASTRNPALGVPWSVQRYGVI